jgi:hypothetical protein
MKINVKILILFLFISILNPSSICSAQDMKESSGFSISNDADNLNKKKKDMDDNFFEMDKLSEKFFTRLAINLIAIFVLIRLIYFTNYHKKELFFTYFIFNFIIFLITYFLNKVDMGIGAAFGLFAVFSMLRYRTENISAKDMTYLFLAIAIGLLTAISKASSFELSVLNGLILLITFFLEGDLFLKKEFSKSVRYENIEMIKPENHPALIIDLKNRTGLNIHKIAIDKVDFLKDTAKVTMYYYEEKKAVKPSDPGKN